VFPAAKCDQVTVLCLCLCLNADRSVQCSEVAYTKRNYITGVSGSLPPYSIDSSATGVVDVENCLVIVSRMLV
jgi:hypothetical protein